MPKGIIKEKFYFIENSLAFYTGMLECTDREDDDGLVEGDEYGFVSLVAVSTGDHVRFKHTVVLGKHACGVYWNDH